MPGPNELADVRRAFVVVSTRYARSRWSRSIPTSRTIVRDLGVVLGDLVPHAAGPGVQEQPHAVVIVGLTSMKVLPDPRLTSCAPVGRVCHGVEVGLRGAVLEVTHPGRG